MFGAARRKEQLLILLLSVLAAARVFVFAAAFPFFSNGDEDLHFDLITQYSHAQVPRRFDRLKEETLNWIVPYASPEFLFPPEHFPDAKFPAPLWKEPWSKVEPEIASTRAAWSSEINWESSQPPLYYALAGVWWKVGQYIGLTPIESLYWIRFLNGLLAALVVWLGYMAARTIAPARIDLNIGVPLLLAFIPQDVLYVLSNDVLSPVCFGAVFLCVLQWLKTDKPSLLLGMLTGLAIAATYLTKLSNLPLLIVAIIAVIAKWLQMVRQQARAATLALILTIICAGVPIGGWMLWSTFHFGDVAGSTTAIALLTWTAKPFGDWWRHPIFSPQGLWTFWYELTARFWRGELMWQNRELGWRVADELYAISSLLLLCAAITGVLRDAGLSTFQRKALFLTALTVVAALAFLALLSVRFDFGECIYPSRVHPYLTSGRLMSGALIPFALLSVYGIRYLLRRVGPVAPIVVVAGIMTFATVSEIFINRGVFASKHNWFHL
jgi:Predicted membrane protein (DUF2142)